MFPSSIDKKRSRRRGDFVWSEVMTRFEGAAANVLSPGLSLAIATELPRRGHLDKQNQEIINPRNIPNVLLLLVALIIARAQSSEQLQNQMFCLNTFPTHDRFILWNWNISYSLIHQFSQYFCLLISRQESFQERILSAKRDGEGSRGPIINFTEIHGCETLWS